MITLRSALMKFELKRKFVVTHIEHNIQAQLSDWIASCLFDEATAPAVLEQIKCMTPLTFSQKLYQFHAQEMVEDCKSASGDNFLKDIKNLLKRCLK